MCDYINVAQWLSTSQVNHMVIGNVFFVQSSISLGCIIVQVPCMRIASELKQLDVSVSIQVFK